jgi:hypothetical protein
MPAPTTPTAGCARLAAPVRHGSKRSVALPLSLFDPRRPASAMRAHPAARAMGANI